MLGQFLCLTAITVAVYGQPSGTGIIAGTVVDNTSGSPVRKAVVNVNWQGTPAAWAMQQTDASGHFQVDSLPAGAFTVAATKEGVGSGSWGANPPAPGKRLTLANGERRMDIVIRLIQPVTISGTVTDRDGDPIPGAQMQLAREGWPRGVRELLPVGGASTNDRGEYRLTNAPPGRVYLSASAPARQMMWGNPGTVPTVFPPQFFGGSSDWKRATPLNLQSGQQLAGIDFRLEEQRTLSVHGRIANLPEAPEAPPGNLTSGPRFVQAMVQMSPSEGTQQRRHFGGGVNPQDGSFHIPMLLPGSYVLTSSVKSGDKTLWASQQLELKADLDDIILTLAPAAALSGKVTVEGESATPLTQLRVELTSPNERGNGPNTLQATPAANGTFTFDQVPPGIWDIGIRPIPKGGYLKSMRLGEQDVLLEEMEIGLKAPPALNIVVSSRGGTLTGQLSGEEAKQVRTVVVLAPEEKLRHVMSFYSVTPVKAEGNFEVTGLTPGKYRLFAFEVGPMQFDLRNPDVLAKLAADSTPVEILEGGKVTADPKVIRTARVQEVLQQ